MPVLNYMCVGKQRHSHGLCEEKRLSKDEQLFLGKMVHYYAGKQRQKQHRQKLRNSNKANFKRRISDRVDKPCLRGLLNPCAG